MENIETVRINEKVADFEVEAFYNNAIKKIKLSDYAGKWVVMFFYPADFTFVCPTELKEMADLYEKFQAAGAEVLSVSTDTVFVHKAWWDNSPSINAIKFPMLADPTGKVCKQFGTYIPGEGLSLRGSFVIDPEGVLKAYEIHDNSIGRSPSELLRKVEAAQYVREHGGEACPVNWQKGKDTLTPGLDLVGKL
ncbi:redoxin domain-containing protein [Candidatus Peregrinibacteria bacterium]|jgi:NADH-dependent peroxiredoxin subunit C|nr:redoxin domain-containing protein [Candidatus Peregrinibacteria bacterium]